MTVDQLSFPLPVRPSDPDTSQLAARLDRSSLRDRVAQALRLYPEGLSDWQLTDLLGEPAWRKPSVGKRREELGAVDTGRRALSPSGLPCVVWALDGREVAA